MSYSLFVVHVHCHVKPEYVAAFSSASLVNAVASVKESGVARFDVILDRDQFICFLLVEVYKDAAAQAVHKEMLHYRTWRDLVALMMAELCISYKYVNFYPDDVSWRSVR